MSVSVCAGWKYCSITISPLACSFWLVLNVCCGKASAGDAGRCKPKSALSCGSAMRVLVFSWARTVAPAACRLPLLSVWSKCQCVSITVFSGALPSPSSVSFNFGQAGRRNGHSPALAGLDLFGQRQNWRTFKLHVLHILGCSLDGLYCSLKFFIVVTVESLRRLDAYFEIEPVIDLVGNFVQ